MLASQIDKERRENRNINTELTLKLLEIQKEIKEITDERDLYKKKLVEATNKYNKLVDKIVNKKLNDEVQIKGSKSSKKYRTNKYIREIKDTLESNKYYDTYGFEYLDGIGIQNIRDIIYEALSEPLIENEEE